MKFGFLFFLAAILLAFVSAQQEAVTGSRALNAAVGDASDLENEATELSPLHRFLNAGRELRNRRRMRRRKMRQIGRMRRRRHRRNRRGKGRYYSSSSKGKGKGSKSKSSSSSGKGRRRRMRFRRVRPRMFTRFPTFNPDSSPAPTPTSGVTSAPSKQGDTVAPTSGNTQAPDKTAAPTAGTN